MNIPFPRLEQTAQQSLKHQTKYERTQVCTWGSVQGTRKGERLLSCTFAAPTPRRADLCPEEPRKLPVERTRLSPGQMRIIPDAVMVYVRCKHTDEPSA